MKHENHTGTSRHIAGLNKWAGLALSAGLLAFSANGLAQVSSSADCVVSNWTTPTSLTDADAGIQPDGFKRYGGPCGLRVDMNGSPRVLTDESPLSESTYIARFYAFLDQAPAGPVTIFSTTDDVASEVFEVIYDGGADTLTLSVYPGPVGLQFTGVGTGWHSIEVVWEASAATDNIRFALNTTEGDGMDLTDTVDTTGMQIVNARLGDVYGDGASGSLYFDDFDSRRISRPGRLLVGDANGDENLNFFDLFELNNELSPGGFLAAGQPDCNEDGEINFFDLFCTNNLL